MRYRNTFITIGFVSLYLLLPTVVRAGNWTNGTVSNQHGARNYKLWLPTGYTGKTRLALVMMLHGCTQTPDDFAKASKFNELADKNNFLVVYPEQTAAANPLKCWNWFDSSNQSRDQGEPSLLAEIVNHVSASYRVDSRRVFVAGFSAGGAMAVVMGATYPDLFAAIGVHSGVAYKAATNVSEALLAMSQGGKDPSRSGQLAYDVMGKAKHMMRVIVFHGVKDGPVASVNADQVITQWSQTNDYVDDGKDNDSVDDKADDKMEGVTPEGYSYETYIYKDRARRPLMEKWIVRELKHAWSGGAAGTMYTDPKGPHASQEMWRFFKETKLKVRRRRTT